MGNPKLNQIIAVVKGVTARSDGTYAEVRKILGKKELFVGLTRKYEPHKEDGEQLPSQSQHVQRNVAEELDRVAKALTQSLDACLTRDIGNLKALADVKVGDTVIFEQVPTTFLLHLEKQIIGHIRSLFEIVPTLDQAELWTRDAGNGGYRTEPVKTVRNITVKEPLVLYPATEKHPAQVQVIDRDIPQGTWERTTFSGAISGQQREAILTRLGLLHDAVRKAIEEANSIEVVQQKQTETLFEWLLTPIR